MSPSIIKNIQIFNARKLQFRQVCRHQSNKARKHADTGPEVAIIVNVVSIKEVKVVAK
jgi:hypothetical protein